ncbi:MAG: cytochrome c3 family protein [Nitrospirae bacterium]|nr:cytochrome c3 family protein [Nitrospirota bacterium]
MNKILSGGLVLLLVLGTFYALNAADNVANTKHNLSSSGTGTYKTTSTTEICIMCHTPHSASLNVALWNKTDPSGPYNMYNSPTIDMIVSSAPQLQSLACLACHDGSIAFDALLNSPGSGNNPVNWQWNNSWDRIQAGEPTRLGTDLAGEHPVSTSYDVTKDTRFNAPVDGKVNGLPIYGPDGRIECGSCHNPHDNQYPPFLRASNTASELCKRCHIK